MAFCLWVGSSDLVTMRCSTRRLRRSARMLDATPSSDRVSSSRKWRRLPKIMSRMTRRLHLSPITSSVRLIGHPERCSSFIDRPRKRRTRMNPVALSYRMSYDATSCSLQSYNRETVMAGRSVHHATLVIERVFATPPARHAAARERAGERHHVADPLFPSAGVLLPQGAHRPLRERHAVSPTYRRSHGRGAARGAREAVADRKVPGAA